MAAEHCVLQRRIQSKIDPNYTPQQIPEKLAHVLNMAMADTGAKGKSVKAEAAREFAEKNLGYLKEGEVNPLREKMPEAAGELSSPWETIRADLVKEIHPEHEAGPGRMREGSEPMTEAVREAGLPKGQFVRAGFMPETEHENFMDRARLESAKRASGTVATNTGKREESSPNSSDYAKRVAGYREAVRTATDPSSFDSGENATSRLYDEISLQEKLALRHALNSAELLRPFAREADASGGEHQVWFNPLRDNVSKETHGYKYGYVPLENGSIRNATPGEYLDRLALHDEHFGDSSMFSGIVQRPGGEIRIRTEQPWVEKAEAPSTEAIDRYMIDKGFSPHPTVQGMWQHPDGTIALDAERRNFAIDKNGNVQPLDLMVRRFPEKAAFMPESPLTDIPSRENVRKQSNKHGQIRKIPGH